PPGIRNRQNLRALAWLSSGPLLVDHHRWRGRPLQIHHREPQDLSLKDTPGKFVLLHHRGFSLRRFRTAWSRCSLTHGFESLAVASRPLQHEFTPMRDTNFTNHTNRSHG